MGLCSCVPGASPSPGAASAVRGSSPHAPALCSGARGGGRRLGFGSGCPLGSWGASLNYSFFICKIEWPLHGCRKAPRITHGKHPARCVSSSFSVSGVTSSDLALSNAASPPPQVSRPHRKCDCPHTWIFMSFLPAYSSEILPAATNWQNFQTPDKFSPLFLVSTDWKSLKDKIIFLHCVIRLGCLA